MNRKASALWKVSLKLSSLRGVESRDHEERQARELTEQVAAVSEYRGDSGIAETSS